MRHLGLTQKSEKGIWDQVFKNGPRKICEMQPSKNLKEYEIRPYPFKFF